MVIMAVIAVLCPALAPDVFAQVPEVELIVGDTIIGANPTLNVFMRNYLDSVESLRFWLKLDRPDVARFISNGDTLVDTTWWQCLEWIDWDCIDSLDVSDSVRNNPEYPYDRMYIDTRVSFFDALDTVNTLISGWEYIDVRSLGGEGYDLLIRATADLDDPLTTPGIPPQYGTVPLVKLNLEALPLPPGEDFAYANVIVEKDMIDLMPIFCNENNDSLCVYWHDVPDTAFYRCYLWLPVGEDDSICAGYERVFEPPYDSIDVRYFSEPYLYLSCFYIQDGTVIIGVPLWSGDANADGSYNLLDILMIIQELYTPGGLELPTFNIDFNCDCEGNLLDVLAMIDWLYSEPPHSARSCTIIEWEAKCGPIE